MNTKQRIMIQRAKLTIRLVLKSLVSRKNYRGLKVVHDDAGMKLMGSPIAMFIGFKWTQFVVVDDSFYSMDESTQEFILAHEYGHSIDKDLGLGGLEERNIKRFEASINGEVVREEAFADDEGVNAVGIELAISALEEIKEALPFFGRSEVNCRIVRLQDKLEGGK